MERGLRICKCFPFFLFFYSLFLVFSLFIKLFAYLFVKEYGNLKSLIFYCTTGTLVEQINIWGGLYLISTWPSI